MNYLRRMMNSSSSNSSKGSSGSYVETASYIRHAHHGKKLYLLFYCIVIGYPLTLHCICTAGSWYSSDSDELDEQLTNFLQSAEADIDMPSRTTSSIPNACISPHAGFRYSGPTAAYSYLALKEALLKNSSLKTIVVVSIIDCWASKFISFSYSIIIATSITSCIFGWVCNIWSFDNRNAIG